MLETGGWKLDESRQTMDEGSMLRVKEERRRACGQVECEDG
jgi:hypothetical protein